MLHVACKKIKYKIVQPEKTETHADREPTFAHLNCNLQPRDFPCKWVAEANNCNYSRLFVWNLRVNRIFKNIATKMHWCVVCLRVTKSEEGTLRSVFAKFAAKLENGCCVQDPERFQKHAWRFSRYQHYWSCLKILKVQNGVSAKVEQNILRKTAWLQTGAAFFSLWLTATHMQH